MEVFSENLDSTSGAISTSDMGADEFVHEGEQNLCTMICDALDDAHDVCTKPRDLLMDPSFYISSTFFTFDMVSFKLMEADLRGEIMMTFRHSRPMMYEDCLI